MEKTDLPISTAPKKSLSKIKKLAQLFAPRCFYIAKGALNFRRSLIAIFYQPENYTKLDAT